MTPVNLVTVALSRVLEPTIKLPTFISAKAVAVIEPLVAPVASVVIAAKYSLPAPSTQIKPALSELPLSIIKPESFTGLFVVPDDKTINGSLTVIFVVSTVVVVPVTVKFPDIVTSLTVIFPFVAKLLSPKLIPTESLLEEIAPSAIDILPMFAPVATDKLAVTLTFPVISVAPSCVAPEVLNSLSLREIIFDESVINPSDNVNVPILDAVAASIIPVNCPLPEEVKSPVEVIAPTLRVPVVARLSSWKLTAPEADLMVPVVNVISLILVPEAKDKAADVVIALSPKLTVVPVVAIPVSLIVMAPNLDPLAPVTVSLVDKVPVIVVAPAANVPRVLTAVDSKVNAPVVFTLLLDISTFPNLPPVELVISVVAVSAPVTLVSPTSNVPVVVRFSFPKLISPVVSVIEPVLISIVFTVACPDAVIFFVTVIFSVTVKSPPIATALLPISIPVKLVDVILPFAIVTFPIIADFVTVKSLEIVASPVIVVPPASIVPEVDSLFEPNDMPVAAEDEIEPLARVKLPTLRVLATFVVPARVVTPLTDNFADMTVSAVNDELVSIVPVLDNLVVPKEISPDVSDILAESTVNVPVVNEPAVTLADVVTGFPIVKFAEVVVILPLVIVISPIELPEEVDIVPFIVAPLAVIFPKLSYITAVLFLTVPPTTPTKRFTSAATKVVLLKMFKSAALDDKSVPFNVNPVVDIAPAAKLAPKVILAALNEIISVLDNLIALLSIVTSSTTKDPVVTFLSVVMFELISISPNDPPSEPADKAPTVVIVPEPA